MEEQIKKYRKPIKMGMNLPSDFFAEEGDTSTSTTADPGWL